MGRRRDTGRIVAGTMQWLLLKYAHNDDRLGWMFRFLPNLRLELHINAHEKIMQVITRFFRLYCLWLAGLVQPWCCIAHTTHGHNIKQLRIPKEWLLSQAHTTPFGWMLLSQTDSPPKKTWIASNYWLSMSRLVTWSWAVTDTAIFSNLFDIIATWSCNMSERESEWGDVSEWHDM